MRAVPGGVCLFSPLLAIGLARPWRPPLVQWRRRPMVSNWVSSSEGPLGALALVAVVSCGSVDAVAVGQLPGSAPVWALRWCSPRWLRCASRPLRKAASLWGIGFCPSLPSVQVRPAALWEAQGRCVRVPGGAQPPCRPPPPRVPLHLPAERGQPAALPASPAHIHRSLRLYS